MFKMPLINQTVVAGRLTKEPELKRTQGGTAYIKFSIAVNNYYQKDGKWEKDTYYFSVTAWGSIAETFANRAFKGAPVIVTGRLSVSKWTDQNGVEKSSTEIVAEKNISVLEWKDEAEQPQPQEQPKTYNKNGGVPF